MTLFCDINPYKVCPIFTKTFFTDHLPFN